MKTQFNKINLPLQAKGRSVVDSEGSEVGFIERHKAGWAARVNGYTSNRKRSFFLAGTGGTQVCAVAVLTGQVRAKI